MGKRVDLVGQKFGTVQVLSFEGISKKQQSLWLGSCDCGNKRIYVASKFKRLQSCGCSRSFKDLTGLRFGRLLVEKYLNHRERSVVFRCICDCGSAINVTSGNLKSGGTKSCGCLMKDRPKRTIHGDLGSKEYSTWGNIKARCHNKNSPNYYRYGGRGITVCDRWLQSYKNFLEDMGRAPSPQHTIDRINNDGNYEPSNCKWATQKEQASHRGRWGQYARAARK